MLAVSEALVGRRRRLVGRDRLQLFILQFLAARIGLLARRDQRGRVGFDLRRRLGAITVGSTYEGEPVPEGIIAMRNITPLHIAEIQVVCFGGHIFIADSFSASINNGYEEQYDGLRLLPQPSEDESEGAG